MGFVFNLKIYVLNIKNKIVGTGLKFAIIDLVAVVVVLKTKPLFQFDIMNVSIKFIDFLFS